jgi:hypothetical protein
MDLGDLKDEDWEELLSELRLTASLVSLSTLARIRCFERLAMHPKEW